VDKPIAARAAGWSLRPERPERNRSADPDQHPGRRSQTSDQQDGYYNCDDEEEQPALPMASATFDSPVTEADPLAMQSATYSGSRLLFASDTLAGASLP
jgi:hypothetical protein